MKTTIKFHKDYGMSDFTGDIPHLLRVGDVLHVSGYAVEIKHLEYDINGPEVVYWVGDIPNGHPRSQG